MGSKYIYIYILKRKAERYLVLVGWALTLQNTLQHTLQHTATHCNTLQHTATHCEGERRETPRPRQMGTSQHTATHCHTLQHTATHCHTLQHTVTRQSDVRRLRSSNQRQRLRFGRFFGSLFASRGDYGMAATSRLLKIVGLFCKRDL